MDIFLIILVVDFFTEFNMRRDKYANAVWFNRGTTQLYQIKKEYEKRQPLQ